MEVEYEPFDDLAPHPPTCNTGSQQDCVKISVQQGTSNCTSAEECHYEPMNKTETCSQSLPSQEIAQCAVVVENEQKTLKMLADTGDIEIEEIFAQRRIVRPSI